MSYYPSSSRQRAYSQSYAYPTQSPQIVYSSSAHSHHSSPGRQYAGGYPQSGTYHHAPQYLTPNYQPNTVHHHYQSGHARSGSGGPVYYASSAPTHHHRDTSRHSPAHHTTTAHRSVSKHAHRSRSQSVPRRTVRLADTTSANRLRRSESRPRETLARDTNAHHHRRGSSSSNEHFTDRIRRMFGLGDSSHHRDRHAKYVDTRGGNTVDWRGRPIYRV